ncbi:hypothetical protein [Sediminibacillus massiliensis]|uniref:hypothetical protein n=1 Tax=Sediminibacillus massiliensis TaxID=1926277 RepID=UPI0009884C19|nr:hypothetical protein [Sediminibacillus massiliensis]
MVKLTDIATDRFLQKYTNWNNLEELERNAPINLAEHKVYWQYLNHPNFNRYIAAHSDFDCWESFVRKATEEFMAKQKVRL